MTTQTTPQITDQATSLAEGLRELAAFIDAHPEMPLPLYPTLHHCVTGEDDDAGVAEIERIAAVLGVEVDHSGNPSASREFAGLTFRAFYVRRAEMRRYDAYTSYAGAVQPDEQPGRAA